VVLQGSGADVCWRCRKAQKGLRRVAPYVSYLSAFLLFCDGRLYRSIRTQENDRVAKTRFFACRYRFLFSLLRLPVVSRGIKEHNNRLDTADFCKYRFYHHHHIVIDIPGATYEL
jgi:hypothetical protein